MNKSSSPCSPVHFLVGLLLLLSAPLLAAPPTIGYIYVSGTTAGPNPATVSAMEINQSIKVWYKYNAKPNAESGTLFQWYKYSAAGTGKTPIAGATTNTLALTAANVAVGQLVSVEITPRDNTGTLGTTVEYKPWIISGGLGTNPILPNTNSCNRAGGGAVSPGNLLDTSSGLCAPRATVWDVTYTGIDYNTATAPRIYIDWGDAGGTFVTITPVLYNPMVTAADSLNLTNQANQTWRTPATAGVYGISHTYSFPTSVPTLPDICTFSLRVAYGLNTSNCFVTSGSPVQTQQFTVWDKEDNTLLGTHDINHDPASAGIETGEITDICEKDQSNIRLLDNTSFNCNLNPLETVRKNDEARWIQFVYGTSTNIASGPGATEKFVINGVSYTTAQLPVYGRVTYQASPTNAPLPAITDNIVMPTTATATQTFVVSMRTWNTCNKLDLVVSDGNGFNPDQTPPLNVFDITRQTSGLGTNQPGLAPQFPTVAGPAIFANATPVVRTYTIRIVAKPLPLTASTQFQCYGVNMGGVNFSVGGFTASNTKWYNKDPRSGTGPALKVLQGPSAATTMPASLYTTANNCIGATATGIKSNLANGDGAQYSVWATQIAGGATACESDPVEVVLIIKPNVQSSTTSPAANTTTFPTTTAAPGGTSNNPVCNNSTVTYTESPNAPTYTVAASQYTNAALINFNTQYNWSLAGGALGTSSFGTTGNSSSVTWGISEPIGGGNTTRTVRANLGFDTSPNCNNNNGSLTVTIYETTKGGSISSNQTICAGTTFTSLTLSGQVGTVLRWERNVNGAGFSTIASTVGGNVTSFNEAASFGTGSYVYRAVVQNNSVCAVVNSNTATITVNAVPPKPTISQTVASNGLTICADGVQKTVLQSDNLSGLATRYDWYKGATLVQSTASNTITLNTVAQSGSYTVQVIGPGTTFCASPASDPVVVAINALPAVTSASGGGPVCVIGVTPQPALDIKFNLSGTAPFTLTYTDGTSSFSGISEPTNQYTVSSPSVIGTYKITSLVDANGCVAPAASMTPTAAVTVGGTAPTFDSGPTLSLSAVCSSSPTDPVLNFSLDDASSSNLSGFTFNYKIDGVTKPAKTFNTGANGNPNPANTITFSDAELNNTAPSPHVINIVSIISPSGCQSLIGINLNFTVNPTPATPTGAVGATACSDAPTGATIRVTDPGAGFVIQWYTTAAGTTLATGATGGARQEQFTPTSNATATYFAFTQSTTAPTLCQSTAGLAVTHTQDVKPATAAAGANQPNLCGTTATMAAGAVGSGGTGTWTVPGKVMYFQNFESFVIGTTSANNLNGWTRDITSGPGTPFLAPLGGAYFEVRNAANKRFEASNTNGNTGAGTPGEVIWMSPVIDISGVPSVDVSIFLDNVSNNMNLPEDYIHVYRKMNGSPVETALTNGLQDGNFTDVTATANGISGTTIQLVARVSNSANTEIIAFDNIVVKATGTTISFSDANSPTASITGLPQNAPGGAAIATTFQWNSSSSLGACAPTTSTVVLTTNPLPTTVDPGPTFCEDVSGGGSHAAVDLTSYNAAVTNGTTVVWYTDAAWAFPVGTPTNVTVNNTTNKKFYFKSTTAAGCVNTTGSGVITFTVNPLPAANNQSANYCEDVLGGNSKSGINLVTQFNDAVTGIAGSTGRTIAWFSDAGLTTAVPTPTNYTLVPAPSYTPVILYAKVTNTTTLCVKTAQVTLQLNPKPGANPIVGASSVCSGAITLLYQVTPHTGATYAWNVPAPFVKFGGGNPSDFFVLIQFPAVGSGTITMQETTQFGCVGAVNSLPVTVNSAPGALTVSGSNQVCTSSSAVYQVAPNPGSTFTWQIISGVAAFNGASSGSNLFLVTLDFGVVATPVVLRVTETSPSGCAGTPVDYNISVSSRPTMTSLNTNTACSGSAPTLTFTATQASTFNWKVTSITGAIGGAVLNQTGTGDLSATFTGAAALTNTSGANGSVSFDITPTSTASPFCPGATQSVVVTVTPKPVIVAGQTKDICNGQQVNYAIALTPASLPATTIFSWAKPTMSDASVQGAVQPGISIATTPHIQDILTNPSNSFITATYNVVPANGSCTYPSVPVVITVEPTPQAVLNNTQALICNGGNTAIAITSPTTPSVPANLTYDLAVTSDNTGATGGTAFGNLTAQSFPANITGTLTNSSNAIITVTFTVTPKLTGCTAGPVQTTTVKIKPTPQAAINNTTAVICNGANVSVVITSPTTLVAPVPTSDLTFDVAASSDNTGATGGTAFASLSAQSFPLTINGTLTNSSNAIVTVTYSVTPKLSGCASGPVQTTTVKIKPTPQAAITNTTSLICNGASVNINVTSPTTLVAPVPTTDLTFDLAVSSDNTGATGGTAFTSLGSQSFPLTIAGTLTNSSNAIVTVTFTVTPKMNGCTSGPVQTTTVKVKPTPQAAIANSTSVICNGANVSIAITSPTTLVAPVPSTDLTFDVAVSSDNTGATGGTAFSPLAGQSFPLTINGTLTNSSNAIVTVTYTVTPKLNGCTSGSVQTTTVKVKPTPQAAIANTAPVICSTGNVNLTFTTPTVLTAPVPTSDLTFDLAVTSDNTPATGGTAFASLTSQSFPLAINGTLTNSSNNIITVTYSVTPKLNGCATAGPVQTTTVKIKPVPQAAISNTTSVICNSSNVNVVISSPTVLVAPVPGTDLTFDVAATSDNTGATGGTAFASLSNQNFPVTINGTLTNSSNSIVTVTYTVTPKLNGCANGPVQTTTVKIKPTPQAAINNTTSLICNGANVNVAITSPTTLAAPVPLSDLTFDLAVGSDNPGSTGGTAFAPLTGQSFPLTINGTLTNSSNSIITVTYTVTPKLNGCATAGPVQTTTVKIKPTPQAVISNTAPVICNAGNTAISITSPTTLAAPVPATDLTFDVAVSSDNGAATGGTAFAALSGQAFPLTISGTLTNSSNGIITITYTVTPKLNGCVTAGPVQTTTVKVKPTPQAVVANTTSVICNGDNVNLTITSPTTLAAPVPGTDLTFDVAATSDNVGATGGTAFANLTAQSFPLTIGGSLTNNSNAIVTVTFTITPKLNGCANGPVQTTTVKVKPTPQAAIANTAPVICNGGNVNLTITSPTTLVAPVAASDLTFDLAVSSDNAPATGGAAFAALTAQTFPVTINGVLTNSSNAIVTVTYTITPKLNGCTSGPVQTTTVKVKPTPQAAISNTTSVICNGANINVVVSSPTLLAAPVPATDLTFDVAVTSDNTGATGGTAFSSLTGQNFPLTINGTLTNSSNSIVTVTFTVTPKLNGCASGPVQTTTVKIKPTPQAAITNSTPLICDGTNVNIAITSPTTLAAPVPASDLTFDLAVASDNTPATGGTAFTALTGQSFPLTISGTLTNNSNAIVTVTYTVTPKLNGCATAGPVQTTTVKVKPTPQASIANTAPVICTGGNAAIAITSPTTLAAPVPATDLTFDLAVSSDNTGATGGTAFTALSGQSFPFTISGTLTNSSNAIITVTYSVTPKLNGCVVTGSVQTTTVKIKPTPQAAIANTTPVICNADNVSVAITSPTTLVAPVAATDLTFDVAATSDNTPATGGTAFANLTGQSFPLTITGTLTNSSNAIVTVTFTVTPKLNGCANGPVQTTTVKIKPTPQAAIANTAAVICNGGNVNLTITSPTTLTAPVSATDLTFDLAVSSDNSLATGGTAFSTLTAQSFPVTINGTLTNSSNAIVTVTYTVTPKLNGCPSGPVQTTTVKVKPTPQAVITNSATVICNGNNANIVISSPTTLSAPVPGTDLTFDLVVTSDNTGATGGTAFSSLSAQSFPLTIAGTLTNSSNAIITVTYSVTPKLNGCVTAGPVQTTTVKVKPTPQAAIANAAPVICNGGNVSLTITSPTTLSAPVPGTDLTFDLVATSDNTGATGGAAFANLINQSFPLTISSALTNSSNAIVTVTYTVTPKLNGCVVAGPVQTTTVKIKPTPQATISNTTPVICNAANVSVAITTPTTLGAPVPASDLTFDVAVSSDNTGATGGTAFTALVGQSFPLTINGTLTNSSNAIITVTYTVTPKLNGCSTAGPVQTTTVKIKPSPQASISNTTSVVCNGDAVNVVISSPTTLSAPVPGTDLTFDVAATSDNTPATGGSAFASLSGQSFPFTINGVLTNSSNAIVTVTYTVTPKLNGCANGPVQTTTVKVKPTPQAAISNTAALICNGGNTALVITSPTTLSAPVPNSDLTFDLGVTSDNTGATGGTSFANLTGQSFPLILTGTLTNSSDAIVTVTFTVTPKLNGCAVAGPQQTTTVKIKPTPKAVISNTTPVICGGDNTAINITSPTTIVAPANPADLTFDVAVSSTNTAATGGTAFGALVGQSFPLTINGTLTNSSNAIITVTYTITPKLNGCTSGPIQTTTVKIKPTPQASIANTSPVICTGGTVNVAITSPTILAAPVPAADLTFDVAVSSDNAGATGGTAFTALTAQSFPKTINGTLTNSSNAVVTVTFDVTPKLNGCANGPVQTTTVKVKPTPQAAITNSTAVICTGTNVNVAITSPTVLTAPVATSDLTFDLVATSDNTPATGGTAFANQTGQSFPFTVNGTLTNSSNSIVTVTFSVTPKLNGCANGPVQTTTVKIKPTPQAAIANTTPVICNGDNVNVTITSPTVLSAPVPLTDLTFDLAVTSDNTPATGGAAFTNLSGQSFPLTISSALTNSSNAIVTVTFTVTPMLNGCAVAGPVKTTTVKVKPTPQAAIANTAPVICNGDNVALTISSPTVLVAPVAATDLKFDVAVSSDDTPNTGGTAFTNLVGQSFPLTINGSLTNAGNNVITVTYSVTPKLNGCTNGPVQTTTVKIKPTPQAAINNTKPVICNGDNVAIAITSPSNLTAPVPATDLTFDVAVTSDNTGATGGTAFTNLTARSFPLTINGTLTNSSNAIITVTFDVTPKLNGCTAGPVQTTTVKIKPTPVAAISNTLPTICTGANTNISITSLTSLVAPVPSSDLTFDLAVSSSNAGATAGTAFANLTNQSFPLTITGTLTNSSSLNVTVTFQVTPKLNGCVNGSPQSTVVVVRPKPSGANDNSPIVCSRGAFNYNIQTDNIDVLGNGVTSNFTFTVSSSDEANVPTPVALDRTIASNAPISGNFTNKTGTDVFITYTITPFNAAGACAGTPFDVVLTVHSEPKAPALTTDERCSGVAINYNLQTIVNNTGSGGNAVPSVFKYTVVADFPVDISPVVFPGTFDRTVASNAPISETFSNYSNHDVTLTYTVTPYSVLGNCDGTPFTLKIVYHPQPVGTDLSDPTCSTTLNHNIQTTQITNGVAALFTYVVSSSDEINVPTPPALDRAIASAAPITDSFTNSSGVPVTVTYDIVPVSTAHGCPGAPFKYQVVIDSKPVGSPAPIAAVCSDVPFSINPQTFITNGVTSTFTWTAVYDGGLTVGGAPPPASGSGVIAGTLTNQTNIQKNATYTITPSAGSCAGLPFVLVQPIDPEPVMDPSLALKTVCSTNATSNNPIGVSLATNGVSANASVYNITLKSQDLGLTGTPTVGVGLANTAIQNDTYNNVTAIPLKVVYTVVPVAGGPSNCLGDPFDITVTVNPEPVVSSALDNTVCSTGISNIILATNGTSVGANTYRLVNVTVPGGLTATPGNAPIGTVSGINLIKNDSYTNNTGGMLTVIYDIRAKSLSGCEGPSRLINLHINPAPIMNPALSPAPACSGVVTGVTLSVAGGSVPASTYNINSIVFPGMTAGPSNTGIGTGKPASAIFNDYYVNTDNSQPSLTATYKVVAVSALGCVGPETTIVITVFPSPAIANNLDKTVCSTIAGGIILASDPGSPTATTFNLMNVVVDAGLTPNGGNVSFPASGVGANYFAGDRFTNTTNNPLKVTYTVQGKSAANCLSPLKDVILTVEPTVIAAPVNHKPVPLCSSSGVTSDPTDIELISPTNPTAGVISFDYSAASSPIGAVTGFSPFPVSGLPEFQHIQDNLVNNSNSPATVTYTITPFARGGNGGTCSGAPFPVVVTVEPKPKMVATPAARTICHGATTNIALSTSTTPSAGTVEFRLKSAVASNVSGTVSGMTVIPGVPGYVAFANGSTLNDNLSTTSSTSETVTYVFTPVINGGAGCSGDDVQVIITVNPRPVATATAQAPICSGDIVNITLSPTLPIANTIFTWTVTAPGTITGASAGAGPNIFQVLFNSGNITETVTYNVTASASGCAGPVLPVSVQVNPKAKIVGVPTTTTVCHGATLNIPLGSNVAAGVSYDWTVDDPNGLGVPLTGSASGASPAIVQPMSNTLGFQATLTYTITATGPGVGPGCVGETKIMIVTVAPQIGVVFQNSPSPDFICQSTIPYYVLVGLTGQLPFQMTYNQGGAPITVTNKPNTVVIQDTPAATTTYTVTQVKDKFGCTLNTSVPFTVNVDSPNPAMTLLTPTITCAPNVAKFQYDQVAGKKYTWHFGDIDSVSYVASTTNHTAVIKHIYENLTPTTVLSYTASLEADLEPPYPTCPKVSPNVTVKVNPTILVSVVSDKTEICSGETVRFINSSQGASTHLWTYNVTGQVPETTMGNTKNINFVFTNTTAANPISYDVNYYASNGSCPAPKQTIQIKVYRNATANFDPGTIPPYVNGQSLVTFTNTTDQIDGTAFDYAWTFGSDSSPDSFAGAAPGTVKYVRPGPKDVTLVVSNLQNNATVQCKSTITKSINIDVLPLVAKFKASPTESCFPSKIIVTDSEVTGDVIQWKVVDANGRIAATSTAVKPVFQLASDGKFTIFLHTENSLTGQKADATPQNIIVYPRPFASFDARPDLLYVPDTELTTFNFSTGANQYSWDFGDGGKSDKEEPTYVYKVEGTYNITLYAKFDHGNNVVCSDTLARQVVAKQGGVTKVPNAFTPNTSGPSSGGQNGTGSFNDVFLPIVKGADEYNLQIFDRWGNLIFESNSTTEGWDGYDKNGRLLPAGVYVYKLTIRLSDGQRSTQIGDVTMIR